MLPYAERVPAGEEGMSAQGVQVAARGNPESSGSEVPESYSQGLSSDSPLLDSPNRVARDGPPPVAEATG